MEGVEEKFSLGAVDYVILGLFIAISAAIGVYYRFSGGKQKSTKVCHFTLTVQSKFCKIIEKNRICEFVTHGIS